MSGRSSRNAQNNMRMAMAQALAKIGEQIAPQMFSDKNVLTGEESNGIDNLKMSRIPPDILLPAFYCHHRGETDGVHAFLELEDYLLRGSVGIDGYAREQAENIVTSLSPSHGKGSSVVKRRGFVSRNVTHRGEPEYEPIDGED
jgi:hypothetical protein